MWFQERFELLFCADFCADGLTSLPVHTYTHQSLHRSDTNHRLTLFTAACSYLGFVDLYGTAFSDNYAASGFGSHMALPIIRDRCVAK